MNKRKKIPHNKQENIELKIFVSALLVVIAALSLLGLSWIWMGVFQEFI